MTKSRQSATTPRLSRLIRCLLALGCIKLGIMGLALFELPMPSWPGQNGQDSTAGMEAAHPRTAPEILSEATTAVPADAAMTAGTNEAEDLPQGSAAAELAAAAKPRREAAQLSAALPAPLVTAGPISPIASDNSFVAPLLPEPSPLGAPLAKAGIIIPQEERQTEAAREDSIWAMLDLKSLPIPGLGSAQAAHAAALDMPVPAIPQNSSPFTPAEQANPLSGTHTVLPGAAPITGNIPHGQSADGAPLAPRQFVPGSNAQYPAPEGEPLATAPAPNVTPRQSPMNPNIQSQELARQQQDMLMLRQQMDQRINDMRKAEDKMKDMLREAKDVEDKKVRNLIQMYANMKPRMAAQAMENMDERIAVRILSGMAPKQSGEILTYTNPVKTAKFTEMITRLRMLE